MSLIRKSREKTYSPEWFDFIEASSISAANGILPTVLEWTGAQSMIDVGCGRGAWLSVAMGLGVDDIFGVDGPWIATPQLHIQEKFFRHADLEKPLSLDREFDLALSLEVAEHLPPAAAPTLVKSLTSLAPVVLFSAAIPGQKGDGHLNEQWPAYWARYFDDAGYVAIDALRPRFWHDEGIPDFYRQNMLIFRRREWKADHPQLGDSAIGARPGSGDWPMGLVHPGIFESRPYNRDLPGLALRRLGEKLRRA